jgi:uncharacterized iron-regulated protein
MKSPILLLLIFSLGFSFPSDKPAYKIFDKSGKEKSFESLVKELQAADVILFGEIHNVPICHWMEFNLAKELIREKKNQLVFGAEMLEADNQIIVNEYLRGLIDYSALKREGGLWEHFDTDYRPILDLAVENKINFIATGIPRRYAGLVARNDIPSLNDLEEEAKKWFPPLPVEVDLNLPGYKSLNESNNNPHAKSMGLPFMAQAQAMKDATMAYFILKNWEKGKLFFHINGAYHSNRYEGIVWYLKKKRPDLRILTISSVEQERIEVLDKENKDLADYIIVIPGDMNKGY